MVCIDENQEAIAQIRMSVDQNDENSKRLVEELNISDGGPLAPPVDSYRHWAIGSRCRKVPIAEFEEETLGNPAFCQFSGRLIDFFREVLDLDAQLSPPFCVRYAYLRPLVAESNCY